MVKMGALKVTYPIQVVKKVLGWVMEEHGIPVAPLVLGIVLGELLEQSFLTSLIKADGSLLAFFTRPIAGVLGTATTALV